MRPALVVAAALAFVAGCGMFRKTFGIKDEPEAHQPPRTTSIFGTWVLQEPDATAFAGANLVEMELSEGGTFVLTAMYPAREPVVVRGTASFTDGTLTLTPEADMTVAAREWRMMAMTPGEPFSLLASAAGNTLVFSPPGEAGVANPSSVWHRKTAAQAAGTVKDTAS